MMIERKILVVGIGGYGMKISSHINSMDIQDCVETVHVKKNYGNKKIINDEELYKYYKIVVVIATGMMPEYHKNVINAIKILKKFNKIIHIYAVTPFTFEGTKKETSSKLLIQRIIKEDVIITIMPNDITFDLSPPDATLEQGLNVFDHYITSKIIGFSEAA